jgi:antitoxin (DNA-binding transcriptional repressor) of toxin-antitoxin stability system
MKEIGVRDFRDHATRYLAAGEPVAIQKHGRVIGFFFPVKQDREATRHALEGLGETVAAVLAETGMTEDELSDWFNLRKPLPE